MLLSSEKQAAALPRTTMAKHANQIVMANKGMEQDHVIVIRRWKACALVKSSPFGEIDLPFKF